MKNKNNLESRRDVLSFLWEWAEEKGNWAKLLLHEISNTSESLSSDKLAIIYKHFRKSIGLPENIEEIEIQKPVIQFSGSTVQITKLHKILGLNRLSPDSVIEFSPNLTVIYGENGTGKSGFSRILKDVGFSYDKETRLIPNIYSSENQDISAEIEYSCDGTTKNILWKPKTKFEELKDISVYNSSCVSISLSEKRNLIVTPLGFSLFDRVSIELDSLDALLKKEINSLVTNFDWFELFHEDTDYKNTILNLHLINNQDIEKLSVFIPDDQEKLNNLENIYEGTSKALLEKELSELNTQYDELIKIKNDIETSKLTFCDTHWTEFEQTFKEIKRLEEKGYSGLEELAKEKGVEIFGKTEFETFIKAADAYINTISDVNYPNSEKARCIYCNQILIDTASIDLINKYKTILKDTTRQELEKYKILFEKFINSFKKVSHNIYLYHSSYGQDENKKPIQPEYIKNYNASFEELKQLIENQNFGNTTFIIDYDTVINSLQKKIDEVKQKHSYKNKAITDIDSEKLRLMNEINILKDKQLFTSKKTDILKIIDNWSIKNILLENDNAFNTISISNKTSKARKELVEKSFADTFLKELNNLRKGHIMIEINFDTKKGETNIHQRLHKQYDLSDILSEGEQKAISLAEFFTELSMDGGNSTVVFDDPVNSLDHHMIDEMAKRIITLCKNRQTVVFTHSILLYNSFLHETKQPYNKSIKNHFYNATNQYELCGIISNAEDEINSPKFYTNRLNKLINNTSKDRPEEEVASEGYAYLRSAIELTVEYEILQGAVKRYQKNIALTNFCKISGVDIDNYKESLNILFEKCCGYISAHSNPTEVVSTPNMILLRNDFEEYEKIRKVFI